MQKSVSDFLDWKGCTRDTIFYPFFKCNGLNFYLPNAFTPNNDGLNDILKVEPLRSQKVEMEVYTRWGELRYKGAEWEGYCKKFLCQPDVYLVKVRILNLKNEEIIWINKLVRLLR